jgi:hypothetical protein
MKARILPPEEWWKLERTRFPPFPAVPFPDIAIVVVEEGEKVIACNTVLRATHLESLWVDPEHKNPGVVRSLMRGVAQTSKGWGTDWAFATACDERMERLLKRLGGTYVVPSTFVLPIAFGG